MKIIDLLNKIANGEEVPERIKDGSFELTIVKTAKGKHYGGQTTSVLNDVFGMERLNDEIEIIEEPMKIEKLEAYKISSASHYDNESTLLKKINEIIDKINEMENK